MTLKYRTERVVSVQDWDDFVIENYGRPYSFQQQDGCKQRGVCRLEVPSNAEDYANDSVPEVINGEEMGVSFEAWKKRDPKAPVGDRKDDWAINLFWDRNFYPDIQVVANDLHAQGKLEAGSYTIIIDW
jgi:hypothetical protein